MLQISRFITVAEENMALGILPTYATLPTSFIQTARVAFVDNMLRVTFAGVR